MNWRACIRWLGIWAFTGLVLLWFIAGPWPLDRRGYETSDYWKTTRRALADAPIQRGDGHSLRVGFAAIDLDPPDHLPLAGYSSRRGKPMTGQRTACTARAVTIASGDCTVTVLSPELLLVNRALAQAVLQRTGLPPEAIFFAATHTHGGPGAYGEHPLEELVMGPYDPRWFDTLADRLAQAVLASRRDLREMEMAFVQVDASPWAYNRIDRTQPVDARLSAWVFRPIAAPGDAPVPPDARPVVLATFAAHPTVNKASDTQMNGDYPGHFMRALAAKLGGAQVVYAAGAVGDCGPKGKDAASMGESLADALAEAISLETANTNQVIANLRHQVSLPTCQPALVDHWGYSPIAAHWLGGRDSHVHLLRLGDSVLIGWPGDVGGGLSRQVDAAAQEAGTRAVVTSLNGDYRGYILQRETLESYDVYETQLMNWHGPQFGAMLTDAFGRALSRVADLPDPSNPP